MNKLGSRTAEFWSRRLTRENNKPCLGIMAFRLLDLKDEGSSLEFEDADTPSVATAIKELFGEMSEIKGILANELRFGGARFLFYFEIEPCIISNCDIGTSHLIQLHSHLSKAPTSPKTN
ncbi:hypothetical protein [Tateyamaria sp.]|uniref:hypothetical protein n=1 Tax=Tateyamaria sp. TaxID=1929288 RepID=UPI0032A0625C